MMIAFASIDPHKGRMGAREARKLIEDYGVKGFKFHPTVQGFLPHDRMAWPLYEVIAEHKLPAIFHSGHSGIGQRHARRRRPALETSNPMLLDRRGGRLPRHADRHRPSLVALAGRGALGLPAQAQRLDRPVRLVAQVFPAAARAVRQHPAQGPHAVRHRLPADRARPLARGFRQAGFKDSVKPLILKQNAIRLLKLDQK
jgi:hypothetical protein